jgi:hypothetical protein
MEDQMGYEAMTADERAATRKRGGLDYRDVTKHRDGFYVGRFKVSAEWFNQETLDRMGCAYLSRAAMNKLGLRGVRCLHRCGCGAHFIAAQRQRECLGCRQNASRSRLAEYTASRSLARAEARAERICAQCGEPMPTGPTENGKARHSTARFCSDLCRVNAWREGRA